MGIHIYITSVTVLLLSVIYLQFYGIFGASALRLVLASVGGIACGLTLVLRNSKLRKPFLPEKPRNVQEMSEFLEKVTLTQFHKPYNHTTIVTSTIDKEIQEIFDLFIRDFCLSWFQDLGKEEHAFKEILTKEMWDITKTLVTKIQQVDVVKFLSSDLVNLLCNHFQELRLSDHRRFPGSAKPFILHSCLSSSHAELEYLRTTSETILYALLSSKNSNSSPLRYLLREILAYTVFQPMFEMICDPDYINQTLLLYLETREKLSESHKKDYAYAETYEEFIRLINTSQDIEAVKQLRYHIIAEIMQATSINNLKGLDHHGKPTQSHDKGEMLRARNLKRYINQCTVAKAQCEKRIKMLGGPDYTNHGADEVKDDGVVVSRRKLNTKRQKVLTYSEIIDNSLARSYFMQFLGHNGAGNMLRFWLAVENMKQLKKAKPDKLQENAREVYNLYVIPSAKHAIRIDSMFVRAMESYLTDGQQDEGFFEAQKQIYQKMEEKFYRKFVISEEYVQYICQLESALDNFRSQQGDDAEDQLLLNWSDGTEGFDQQMQSQIGGKKVHSLEERNDYIIKQLSILDQKLASKTQQVELVKKLHDMHIQGKLLEKEIESLKKEKCDLEAHMERAELWCDNIGKWKVLVQSASIENTNDKPHPVYILMVHRSSHGDIVPSSETEGWMIARTLKDFHTLHSKLKECCNRLKKELPLPSKKWFKHFDDDFLNKSKIVLEDYLQMLLEDETLSLNEELYQFLCPSLENLKQIAAPVEKKSGFSLKSVLKSFPLIDFNFTEELDEEPCEEDGSWSNVADRLVYGAPNIIRAACTVLQFLVGDRKDSIAEPLYSLTGEVFELKGVFKWLRRTLIAFVQVTFGRTINREIRELVEWIVSEPMIVYYIQTFCDVMWPQGKLAHPSPKRSDAEKLKTRRKVKEKLLEMSPEVLQNLVGKRNCKLGIIKMFEAFQDIRTNKHLVYLVFELCIFTLFPEIRNEAPPDNGNMQTASEMARQSDEESV